MKSSIVRPVFPRWPEFNRRLRDRVAAMSDSELAIRPSPDRWPLWATIGHLACQRVFWLCDFAGEPGASESPFPNAGFNCPGDDDLEHVWNAAQLADAIDRTFGIVERCLDTWTIASLPLLIDRSEWGPGRIHSRAWVLEGSFAHDVWHIAELNEALTAANLAPVGVWG